jgi:outer membrane protein TolC
MSVLFGTRALRAGILAATIAAPCGRVLAQAPTIRTLTLDQAIGLAQEQGLAAQGARSARDAARLHDRAFTARLLPRLSLTGDAANLDRGINSVTLPTGETQFIRQSRNQSWLELAVAQPLPWTGGELTLGSRLTRVDQLGDETSTHSWQTTPLVIGIRQGLFRPRALEWDRREQELAVTVAERQYLEAREDVAAATAVAFFDLFAAQVALDNAVTNAAVNDTLYRLNTGRFDVGKIGENDLLQSELALLRSRAALDGARLAHSRTTTALRRLLRLPAGEPLAVTPPDVAPDVAVDPDMAVERALRSASILPDDQLRVLRTQRQVSEARSAAGFRADVEASVGFNQTSPGFASAYESPLAKQQLAMRVEMPLLQWGGGRAGVDAARTEQTRAELSTQARREVVEEEARFAALELAQSRRVLLISATADTVAAKRFDVAKNRYVIGRIGIGELYIAQSEKDGALESYVQALRAYWSAHYRLRRLTLYDFALQRALE